MNNSIQWYGISGNTYLYFVYDIDMTFRAMPGNYIYAKKYGSGQWKACYIGQTEDLEKDLSNQDSEKCARKCGATHIHAHFNSHETKIRSEEQSDLIERYKPPCNEYPEQ